MNKLALSFLVALSLLCFSCEFGRKVSDRADGKWLFSYEKTWEYKNPGKKISENEKSVAAMIGRLTMTIDTKNKTVTSQIHHESPTAERYRVLTDEKNKFSIRTDKNIEVFEFIDDGVLLMCPATSGTDKCMAFTIM